MTPAATVGIDTPDVRLVPVRAIRGLPPDALAGELAGANASPSAVSTAPPPAASTRRISPRCSASTRNASTNA